MQALALIAAAGAIMLCGAVIYAIHSLKTLDDRPHDLADGDWPFVDGFGNETHGSQIDAGEG